MKTINLASTTENYLLWTTELDEKTKLTHLDEMPDDAEISIFRHGTGVEYLNNHGKSEKVIHAGGLFKKSKTILRVKKQTFIYKKRIDLPSKQLISVRGFDGELRRFKVEIYTVELKFVNNHNGTSKISAEELGDQSTESKWIEAFNGVLRQKYPKGSKVHNQDLDSLKSKDFKKTLLDSLNESFKKHGVFLSEHGVFLSDINMHIELTDTGLSPSDCSENTIIRDRNRIKKGYEARFLEKAGEIQVQKAESKRKTNECVSQAKLDRIKSRNDLRIKRAEQRAEDSKRRMEAKTRRKILARKNWNDEWNDKIITNLDINKYVKDRASELNVSPISGYVEHGDVTKGEKSE